MSADTLTPTEAWALAALLIGGPRSLLGKLTGELGRAAGQALAGNNGAGPDAALNAWLATLPPATAEGVRAAILAADPDGPEPADRFALSWAAEAFERQPDVDWIVDRLFQPGGVYLLVGPPGAKKTWAMLDCAIRVAMGADWLGFPVRGGPVLFVDEESGPRRYKRRLRQLLRGHAAPRELPLACVSLAGFNLRNQADIDALGALVGRLRARLVVIDALADVMLGADENSVKDVQPVFHALRRIAEAHDCAFVVIHHEGKAGGYRGSSAMRGAVDAMIAVASAQASPNLDFDLEKGRDVEPFKFAAALVFDDLAESARLIPTGATPRERRPSPAKAYVLRYLTQHDGRARMKDIKDHADTCTSVAAERAVYALADEGIVRRCDSGGPGRAATYELAPDETVKP